jgi:hypothetical protein
MTAFTAEELGLMSFKKTKQAREMSSIVGTVVAQNVANLLIVKFQGIAKCAKNRMT